MLSACPDEKTTQRFFIWRAGVHFILVNTGDDVVADDGFTSLREALTITEGSGGPSVIEF